MLIRYYLLGCAVFVVALLSVGCVVNRKEGLGHGIRLGILNSLLLGLAWPLTVAVLISSLFHDCYVFWKRL